MTDIIEDVQKVATYLKVGWFAILTIISGFLGLEFGPEKYSSWLAFIGNVGFIMGIWWVFDKYILKDIDTIEEIKKGNIAVAILVLAFVLLFAISIHIV